MNTAIVGRIPSPVYIGAVAVGALIFTFAFWGFGFLRMGTTGLTAQAFGAADNDELAAGLGRALLIAAAAGVGLILLQWPIRECAFALVGASPEVERVARGYFNVRIWSGPATLANYALLGWFVGLGRTHIGLVLQLVLNLTNVLLDAAFVLGFGWGVPGVALGTVLAEYLAAAVGIVIALKYARRFGGHWSLQRILSREQLKRAFLVNSDIMIRSLALLAAFGWFLAQGARQGNAILAGNSILMQFIEVCAFFLDGFAFAAEALVGRGGGRRATCRPDGGGAYNDDLGSRHRRVARLGVVCVRSFVHRWPYCRYVRACGGASLPAVGGRGSVVGCLGLPARWDLHRRHAHRGHEKRDAGLVGDLSFGVAAVGAVR